MIKFIELPVYEHPFRKSCNISYQLIRIDSIVRIYSSENQEYNSDTYIELIRQFNTTEPIRIALPYSDVVSKLTSYVIYDSRGHI